jgi:hypothetical protein
LPRVEEKDRRKMETCILRKKSLAIHGIEKEETVAATVAVLVGVIIPVAVVAV